MKELLAAVAIVGGIIAGFLIWLLAREWDKPAKKKHEALGDPYRDPAPKCSECGRFNPLIEGQRVYATKDIHVRPVGGSGIVTFKAYDFEAPMEVVGGVDGCGDSQAGVGGKISLVGGKE